MIQEISFFVPGVPQPGGSKRAFYNKKLKRSFITEANPKSKDWRASVVHAASEAMKGREVIRGPVELIVQFNIRRPKGHFGSGKNAAILKPSAPQHMTARPDCSKYIRSTEDALKGLVWLDDSQVVDQHVRKMYCEVRGSEGAVELAPGAMITILELEN